MAARNRITTWQQQDVVTYQNSGSMNLWGYGLGVKTSSFQSKTESGYVAVWSTDGNLLEKHISEFSAGALPSGVVSSSNQVISYLPSGLLSSSNQVTFPSNLMSSSAQVNYNSIQNQPSFISSSAQVSFLSITNVPSGLVSASNQISYGSVTGIPSGILSSSNGFISSSNQITYSSISGVPTGLFSSSLQVDFLQTYNRPTLISGSSQISFGSIANVPSGLLSSSAGFVTSSSGFLSSSLQVDFLQTYNRPTLISGSSQISFTSLSNVPTGIVSSSVSDELLFNTITSIIPPQTLSSTIADNLIKQGGTQAVFTFNLPATPVNGYLSQLTFTNAVTVLTISGNGNSTVGTLPTAAAIADRFEFKFYSGSGWVRIQ